MTLTNEQQELLHAWVDGETTEAEGRIASELLSTSEPARSYVTELERLRLLLESHAGVQAPAGLRDRVCSALKLECDATVHQMPIVNWRTLALAAAAAVVVSLGLIFGPNFTTSDNSTDGEVAVHQKETGNTYFDPGVEPFPTDLSTSTTVRDEQPGRPDEGNWSGAVTPPGLMHDATPNEPADMKQPADRATEKGENVLRLDRGRQPLEISVNLDRDRDVSVLQVYNDMLIVSCFYGDAQLRDDESDAELEEEFNGHDFAALDSLEVNVESSDLPHLLAALDRMAKDQGYGSIVLPGDLRKQTSNSSDRIDQLQELNELVDNSLSRTANADANPSAPGPQGYLPADLQRECLRKKAGELSGKERQPDKELEAAFRRLAPDTVAEDSTAEDGDVTDGTPARSRKVKLVIRLR